MMNTYVVDNTDDGPNCERVRCFDEEGTLLWESVADASVISLKNRIGNDVEFEDLRTKVVQAAPMLPSTAASVYSISDLANQLGMLTGAVDELILAALMGV